MPRADVGQRRPGRAHLGGSRKNVPLQRRRSRTWASLRRNAKPLYRQYSVLPRITKIEAAPLRGHSRKTDRSKGARRYISSGQPERNGAGESRARRLRPRKLYVKPYGGAIARGNGNVCLRQRNVGVFGRDVQGNGRT